MKETKMTKKEKSKTVKKYALILLLCFIFFIAVNIPLQNILSDFWIITIDVVIGGGLVFLLNLCFNKYYENREKKRQQFLDAKYKKIEEEKLKEKDKKQDKEVEQVEEVKEVDEIKKVENV